MKTYEFQIAQTIVEKGWGSVEAETLKEAKKKIRELIATEGADAVSWGDTDVKKPVRSAEVFDDDELVAKISVEM
jgi:hypothetical protein